jgi:2-polyprenyl-3-methyl-5-hydroxy-6-metoxy-1,4-benzoquinol methylase
MKYLAGDATLRDALRHGQELEAQWYASISTGSPLWAVYDTDFYLADLWACWRTYSRKYINGISGASSLRDGESVFGDLSLDRIKRVVDVGCGIGFTTAAWRELFPSAEVIGTNLEGTRQMQIAKEIGAEYGFKIESELSKIEGFGGLVFASEYFEHFQKPVEHLHEIVAALNPDAFLIASAFSAKSIGHFPTYQIDGEEKPGKEVSRIFNDALRKLGFAKIKTKLWNNRPSYWKKINALPA